MIVTTNANYISNCSFTVKLLQNLFQAQKSTDLSVHNLAKYLTKASKTNLGRVRAFYYWICHHVEYVYRSIYSNLQKYVTMLSKSIDLFIVTYKDTSPCWVSL
jgi:hypothetical protein